MKKITLVLAALVLGFILFTGCQSSPTQHNPNNPKTIIIENITQLEGANMVWLGICQQMPHYGEWKVWTAIRWGLIANDTLKLLLDFPKGNNVQPDLERAWNGTGQYYIVMFPTVSSTIIRDDMYIYTDGGNSPSKVNIVEDWTTLDFSKFKKASEL